jgi:phosphoribosylformylglycinamidine cyclo-ligase
MTIDYKSAGVDIEAGNLAVEKISSHVKKTFNKNVLTGLGSFGALFDLKSICQDYKHPVMVQSIDGVGTKVIVAKSANNFTHIGADLVSAAVNDIVVMGAKPLTMLDYIANDHLDPNIVETIVAGMAQACVDGGIALVGGETAEMPGTYLPGEHDLVGIVTGIVEKDKIINGSDVKPGDKLVAFASSGIHTNGFSLARKALFEIAGLSINDHVAELSAVLSDVLLTPHINYTNPVHHLLDNGINIKSMAHITGGGFIENIPRVIPDDCGVTIQLGSWPEQAIFSLMQDVAKLEQHEMYRTFNMGIGMVLIVSKEEVTKVRALSTLPVYEIGEVVASDDGNERVILR